MTLTNFRRSKSRVFVITGSANSGKDYIISAIKELAKNKASIVVKRTSRNQARHDGSELICKNIIDEEKSTENNVVYKPNPKYDINECNIKYSRKGNIYGVNTKEIWDGLKKGMFQVISLSEENAINQIIDMFGKLVVLIYSHSNAKSYDSDSTFETYINNIEKFNHVVIYEDKKEDLYDQVFRLLYYYENKN